MLAIASRLGPRGLLAPQVAGGVRGLAWKTSGRPTRAELMSGSRRGWNIRRQLVPAHARIPFDRWKLVVGDTVEVTNKGSEDWMNKDFKKRGTVLEVRPLENRVVVSGINMQTKNLKPGADGKPRVERKPGPIHYSNVHLIDPETDRPTRVSLRMENNKQIRVAARTKAIIPYPKKPPTPRPTKEDSPFDTSKSEVHSVTYSRYEAFKEKMREAFSA